MDNGNLLLLLIVLLLGLLLGRISIKGKKSSSETDLNCSQSYIQGLNYLLANNSDKAIQLFVDLIKVDNETMETHLALGNLFRSKGEVDKAIKIHQNLIARPNLDQAQRVMALSELASDYLKAGLLDRAENLYKELLQINPKNRSALKHLLELYTMEKSWGEAREVAEILYNLKEPDSMMVLNHCYCEMAELQIKQGNLREARSLLDKALLIDTDCIRAKLLIIDIHLRNNEETKAIKFLNQLVDKFPEQIELFIRPARELFLIRGTSSKYLQFLTEQYIKRPNAVVALQLLQGYLSTNQHEPLLSFLEQALQKSPSLNIFDFAFAYIKSRPQEMERLWPEILQQFEKIKNARHSYLCSVCGYSGHEMHWNCPSCNSWSSLKPLASTP